jgi:hypothetical protein
MVDYFRKLNKNFIIGDCDIKDVQISYGHETPDGFSGIQYCFVEFENKDDIMNIIPKEYQKYFFMTIMRINREIPPHTDSGIKSTINFYIQTDDCITQFYKFKTDSPKLYQVKNQSDGFLFDESDLDKMDYFVSKPTEAWVLDVTKPHSVIPQSTFNKRLAIAISSELEYDVVCDILKDEGYL